MRGDTIIIRGSRARFCRLGNIVSKYQKKIFNSPGMWKVENRLR